MAIITISRGTFSGGKAVAEQLAEQLDHTCLSREDLIRKAAEMFHLDENALTNAMEDVPGIFLGNTPASSTNANFVRAALLQEIRNPNLIYHGYAGDLLLHGVRKVLRVRVMASKEYRIKAVMADHSIDRKSAVAKIEQLDKRRDRWAIEVLGTEWSDPALYDVSLNLDSISIESAVRIIAGMTVLEEFTVDDSTARSLEDLLISSSIWAALAKNKPTSGVQVLISTQNGHVTVKGSVASRRLSDAILEVGRNVSGVKTITNGLQVGPGWFFSM